MKAQTPKYSALAKDFRPSIPVTSQVTNSVATANPLVKFHMKLRISWKLTTCSPSELQEIISAHSNNAHKNLIAISCKKKLGTRTNSFKPAGHDDHMPEKTDASPSSYIAVKFLLSSLQVFDCIFPFLKQIETTALHSSLHHICPLD